MHISSITAWEVSRTPYVPPTSTSQQLTLEEAQQGGACAALQRQRARRLAHFTLLWHVLQSGQSMLAFEQLFAPLRYLELPGAAATHWNDNGGETAAMHCFDSHARHVGALNPLATWLQAGIWRRASMPRCWRT